MRSETWPTISASGLKMVSVQSFGAISPDPPSRRRSSPLVRTPSGRMEQPSSVSMSGVLPSRTLISSSCSALGPALREASKSRPIRLTCLSQDGHGAPPGHDVLFGLNPDCDPDRKEPVRLFLPSRRTLADERENLGRRAGTGPTLRTVWQRRALCCELERFSRTAVHGNRSLLWMTHRLSQSRCLIVGDLMEPDQ